MGPPTSLISISWITPPLPQISKISLLTFVGELFSVPFRFFFFFGGGGGGGGVVYLSTGSGPIAQSSSHASSAATRRTLRGFPGRRRSSRQPNRRRDRRRRPSSKIAEPHDVVRGGDRGRGRRENHVALCRMRIVRRNRDENIAWSFRARARRRRAAFRRERYSRDRARFVNGRSILHGADDVRSPRAPAPRERTRRESQSPKRAACGNSSPTKPRAARAETRDTCRTRAARRRSTAKNTMRKGASRVF